MRLQVRQMDGAVFWVTTEKTATVASIKQSIQEQQGIDVIMQKLICAGRLLPDDVTPELSGISERDFLVLVTAKPRPPSLMTTGAPLPPSYPSQPSYPGMVGPEVDEEGEEGEEEGGEEENDDGGADPDGLEDEVDEATAARFVAMGFAAREVREALRLAQNDPNRALSLLRSGHGSLGSEALGELEDRLRRSQAFGSLQQVVRVDPQIMLVLNTEAMRFEEQKSGQLLADGSAEREAVEAAFWEACCDELCSSQPGYDRTLQLLHEVRDTLCNLMPSEWEEQLLAAGAVAEELRVAIEEAVAAEEPLLHEAVARYTHGVGELMRLLSGPGRADEVARWLGDVEQAVELNEQCPRSSSPWGEREGGDGSLDAAAAASCRAVGALPFDADAEPAEGSAEADGSAGGSNEERHTHRAALLLLRFFRGTFEHLQAIKLDLANAQLARLLAEDDSLRHTIASQPSDFVLLLNAAGGGEYDEAERDAVGGMGECERGEIAREYGGGESDCDEHAEEPDDHVGRAEVGGDACACSADGRSGLVGLDHVLGTHERAGCSYGAGGAVGSVESEQAPPARPALLPPASLEIPAPEAHSELMEAVMQQWLHTPAGQEAAQEAARLQLGAEDVGQFFHACMLQSLSRLRIDNTHEPSQPEHVSDSCTCSCSCCASPTL